MIRDWHICISGFLQDLGHRTGIERLFMILRILLGATTEVDLRLWNEDWDKYARYVWRNSARDARIHLFAYSWGGGWGAMKLCKALAKIQAEERAQLVSDEDRRWYQCPTIEVVVLCDAVYRSPWTPDWLPLNPKSLLPHPKIKVPANVRRVIWFYQRNDHPRGHTVVAADPTRTTVEPGIEIPGATHATIDEAQAFHVAAQHAAGIPF